MCALFNRSFAQTTPYFLNEITRNFRGGEIPFAKEKPPSNRQDFLSILNEKRIVINPRNIRRTKATTRSALRILVQPRRRNTANIFTLIIVIGQSSNISGVRRRDAIYIHFYHYYYRSFVSCWMCVLCIKTRFSADATVRVCRNRHCHSRNGRVIDDVSRMAFLKIQFRLNHCCDNA